MPTSSSARQSPVRACGSRPLVPRKRVCPEGTPGPSCVFRRASLTPLGAGSLSNVDHFEPASVRLSVQVWTGASLVISSAPGFFSFPVSDGSAADTSALLDVIEIPALEPIIRVFEQFLPRQIRGGTANDLVVVQLVHVEVPK